MNPENRTWRPIDPEAGSLPEGLESALGDGDSVSACVVVLVDSEIDSEWGAQATLAVARRWAASGRRVILVDACLDCPVLHQSAGIENGEGVCDMVLYGASVPRIARPVGEGLYLVPAGTPVVRVADVLTHLKWDAVIRGCREAGVTLVLHVSTGTPGAQALTERAEGVLVLAPSSRDVDTVVGSEWGPLIAVLGPGNGGGPSVSSLLGITLPDPEEAVAGVAEKPLVELASLSETLAELKAAVASTEDVLGVEGLPGLLEEAAAGAFSVDESPDLAAGEGEEGATSDAGVASLSGSSLAVSEPTVRAGETVTLTLTARDAGGNLLAGLTSVAFGHTGGTATGDISAVTDQGDGTYTAIFTGRTAGTATTLQATIDGEAVTSTLPTMNVTLGTPSLSDSTVVVSAAIVVAGGAVTLTLTARDPGGNLLAGLTSVAFGHTGGTSTGAVSAVTDQGDGTYTAVFTGQTVGTATTLHATIDGETVAQTADVTVTVGAVSLSGSSLAVSEPTVAAGEMVTLTLTARDASGNLLAGLRNAAFGHIGGIGTGDISAVTEQGNGTYTATFTGQTAGTATTLHATIDGETVAQTADVAVTLGAVSLGGSSLAVSEPTMAAGERVTLTLTARDAWGNLLAGLTNVAFGHTGGTSTGDVSAITDQGDGNYTATFTGQTAGAATTLHATVEGETVAQTVDVTVTVGAPSLTLSTVEVSAPTVAAGEDVTLTLTVRDPGGNLVSGLTEVAFDHTGGDSPGEISAVTDQGDGTYTASLTGQTAGTATTLQATIDLEAVAQTADVAVTLGAVSPSRSSLAVSEPTVAAGESVTLTLVARDAGGNLLAGLTNVALDHTGGTSTGDISAVTDQGDGTYTVVFTGQTVGTATTLHATIDGETVAQTVDVAVTLGAVSLSGSSLAFSKPTVVAGETVSLTLTARDAGGNLFAGLTNVAFGRTGGTGTGDISAVTDQGDGTYTATFTGKTAGTATTIEATIDGETVAQTADVAVMVGVPSLTLSTVEVSAPTVASGEDVTLTLTARDPGGNLLAGLTDVAFGHTGGSSTGDISAVTDQGDGTYTTTFTGQTAGTATTLQATIGGEAVASTLPTMNVTLGTPSLSKSTVVVSADTVAAGGAVALTLTVRDPGSNPLIGHTEVALDHTGGGSTGEISAVTDQGDGTYIAIFTGQTAGTATTLQATIDGEAVTSTVPTMTVTLGPPSLSNSTVVVSAALVAAGAAVTLTLTARDPGGNLLSGLTEVAFDSTGGERTGEISATTDQDDGTYTATFTGRTAGGATTLQATIDGETVVQTADVVVTLGAVSVNGSSLAISEPTVAAGERVTLTLTVADAGGNLLAGLTKVAFDHTGGTSTGDISAVTDQGDGTYTAVFTGKTAGSATTLQAAVAGETVAQTAVVAVTLGAVSLRGSSLVVSEPTVAAGERVTVILRARDAGGNLLAGLTKVAFAHTGGTGTGDISAVTEQGNGTYTATFTGQTAGTATTLYATIDGETVAQTADVTVTLGSVSLSGWSLAVSEPTVAAGETVTLTLTARDRGGNLLAGLTNAAFAHAGGTSTGDISAVTDQGDGTYTATFTGQAAGTATTLHATVDGETVAQTADVTVTIGAPSLTLSTVEVSAAIVVAGEDVTLTLTARDPGGNLLSGLAEVAFAHTGQESTGEISAVRGQGNGTYTATLTGQTAGTATTLQATIDGEALTSTLPTMTVTLGPLSLSSSTVVVSGATVAAGGAVTLTLTARDAGGNLLAGLTNVAFVRTGGTSTGDISAVTDQGDGTYTANFTGQTVGTATTLRATVDGETVAQTADVTVALGAVAVMVDMIRNLFEVGRRRLGVDSGAAGTKSVIETARKTALHVVLAEDDDDYAIVVELALENAADVPVEIRRARTGMEALVLLRGALPDLLLLDLKMPGMKGHDALEEIKGDAALRSVPVAILTSSDRDEDMAKSYGLRANHFITKPRDPAELEAKLRAFLRSLTDLGVIRREPSGASTTAVKVLRWVAVVAVLVVLYFFGRFSGAF